MASPRCAVLFACLLSLLATAAIARADRPGGSHERLVYSFDFEERDEGNFEDLPMHWFPIGRPRKVVNANFDRLPVHRELVTRPGFPVYTDVRFDDQFKSRGEYSFYLGLNGGSVGAFLETGTMPVVPNSDYLITAAVRTTSLQHARARVVAYLIDERGNRIDSSVSTSQLVKTDGRWDTVSVRLSGDHPRGAWMGLELQLLQPSEHPDSPLGKHQIVYQEVRGGAWFDDIGIWQLPHVTVGTQSPVNIIRAPDRPRLIMQVRDLTGRALQADVTVYDHDMRLIATSTQGVGDGAPSSWRWSPSLPAFGWYLVDLVVREPEDTRAAAPVARNTGAFLWLGDDPLLHVDDAMRFSLLAEDVGDDELDLMPTLFERARLDAGVFSAWHHRTTQMTLEDRQSLLDNLFQGMAVRGREVTVSFAPAPEELARLLDIDRYSPIGLFSKPQANWMPYVSPVLLRHGQRVRRWQVGSTRQPDLFFLPELPRLVTLIDREFQNLAPEPQLVLPWRIDQSRRPDIPTNLRVSYLIDVPFGVRPENLSQHLDEWRQDAPAEFYLNLREPPATELSQHRRVEDLVQRMLYGWEGGASGLSLTRPWTVSNERRLTLIPDPILGAFTTVAHRVAGRRVVGRMPLGDGMECLIFNGPSGGMLAAWSRSAPDEEAVLDMFLGPAPVAIDVWGNRANVPMVEGRHRWKLSTTPVFFEGIDPALALFRAKFHIEDPFIESTQTVHERGIVVSNPWPRTISGHLLITQPDEWRIEPRKNFFSIAAGQTQTIPLELSFPVSEVAGKKRLVTRFDFNADQHYVVDLTTPLELGLTDVDFDADLSLEVDAKTGRRDAVVTMLVTNSGAKLLSLYAFAHTSGQPRQERPVSRLKPGQSVVKRFRFAGVGDTAEPGTVIRVGLRETSGPALLNKVLTLGER